MEKSRHIYTVSEITQDIKIILENTFGEVWVEGEISNFRAATSGHFYFTLKDKDAVLSAAMFVRANRQLKFKIEDGLKVICFGKVDIYPPRGQYQLIVESIEPKGVGAQQLAFEQLKNRLLKEGLFDPAHKKPLPLMPFRAGIVTSSAGAAVRDILQILKKGAPCVDVIIRSARVQGEGAALEIAEGVEDFNRFKEVDVIIISRGGGSTEDLWAFNEEVIARAIYNSTIPTISAVGHQINTTLSDLVADVFVETPSAAAKIIVDKKNKLLSELESYKYELISSVTAVIQGLKNNLIALRHMLKSPLDRLLEKQQLLDELSTALLSHIRHCLSIANERALSLIKRLEALSPLAVLSRGYSLSTLVSNGAVVKDAAELKAGDLVKTMLKKGSFLGTVQEVIEDDKR
ncbi:MAG: exodeoxyribonuclease VII large subunit [Candidatus Omnitrophica bacterium]|nr:exodeoxyribonuclease VII large subunit [Candidatus Omnitrophota bacterium]